jgi:phenylacetate-coenzyme A ligase PaaK-like adenylate-forming protein
VTESQALPPLYDRLASLIADGAPPNVTNALRGAALEAALRHARASSPFYARRISQALLAPGAPPALWRTVRLLTKDELRANLQAIQISSPPAFAGATRAAWTSGSTGSPLHCLVSALADHMSNLALQRFYRWWQVDPALDLLNITLDRAGYRDRPTVETLQGWHPADPRGKYHRLTVNTGLDAQLDRIVELKPAYLKTFATHLGALAARARERGLDIAFRLIFSGGGPLPDDERALAGDVFKCRVADIYGCEEIGVIAAGCPQCGTYHPALELMHFEVLRDDGAAAQLGDTGRAIVTPFLNFAMPLIRYELGDFVELGQGGQCPNGALSLRRIVGRRKNMFTLSNGQKFWPYVALADIAKLGPIARFRFVQTGLSTVEFRYALAHPAKIDEAMLTGLSRKYLSPLLNVVAVPMPPGDDDPARKFLVYESLV